MTLFVFFCIFALIAVITFGLSFFLQNDVDGVNPKRITRFVALGVVLFSFIPLFFASWTSVGTKNVAVLTTFGKPTSYLTNGFHFKSPWATPHELTDAVQTDTYASDGGDAGKQQGGAVDTCIHVRIARQGIGCVNVSIRWQIRPDGVDYLFRNYKGNAAITDNLVLRDLQTAMNVAFADYDPLGIDNNGMSTNKPLTSFATQVQSQMVHEVGQWIDVQSLNIPIMNYDSGTQTKISQFLQQVVATKVAQQAEQTALAQAAANKALAASVSNDPNVLTDKCLNILKEAVDKGNNLPAGFSCFSGASTPVAVAVK